MCLIQTVSVILTKPTRIDGKTEMAVYHLCKNHTVTLFELHVKSRYQMREWPLG